MGTITWAQTSLVWSSDPVLEPIAVTISAGGAAIVTATIDNTGATPATAIIFEATRGAIATTQPNTYWNGFDIFLVPEDSDKAGTYTGGASHTQPHAHIKMNTAVASITRGMSRPIPIAPKKYILSIYNDSSSGLTGATIRYALIGKQVV